MPYLSLSLLGPFQAWTANGALQPFRTQKERALLAYMMVENGHIHQREALASLFWPERPEGTARNNLRQALFGIRQVVGEEGYNAIFNITGDDIQVNLVDHVWLDLAAFDVHFKAYQSHQHSSTEPCPYCMQHLRDAVEFYRGSFMDDVILDKNPEVQQWVIMRREQYRRMLYQALEYLINGYEQMHDCAQAAFYAARQVQLDDLKEELYYRLMLLLAKTGQSSAALEQYDLCQRRLREARGGELDPKTVLLADQIREDRLDVFALPAREVIHNLPEHLTPFIGREMELTQIGRNIENPSCRIITLIGPGGVGKTRLAIRAVQLYLYAFSDGIFYVPLDAVASADQLPEAIVRTLGLSFGAQQDIRAALLDYLCSKHILLLLDNFEHLLEGSAFLVDILQAAPYVKILVTSRERLHLQAEYLMELRGLPFPTDDGAVLEKGDSSEVATQVGQSDAVKLLIERAGRVAVSGSPSHGSNNSISTMNDPQEMAAAVHICQLVEGLPLAIELAASWVRDFTFTQIADEVQRNLEFLQASFQDMPERHRSLRASFEHSWDLLSESEREVFCKLAVFPGSFSVDAAQAVAGAALPWLVQLEDKSLVRRVAFGRYDLHPLIRQFAGLKLRQYSRRVVDHAAEQHAHFFCQFLKERELGLKGGRQAEALNEIEAELENIRTAWNWAAEHHFTDLLSRGGIALMFFFEYRSYWIEGEERFSQAVQSLQQAKLNPTHKTLLGYLMAAQGWFCCRITRFQQAEALLLQSLQLITDDEANYERVFAHFTLGFLYVWMSRFPEALLHLTTCLSTSERVGDMWGAAWSRELLAEFGFESGQTGFREDPFRQTLALFESAGEQRGASRALNYLGNIAMAQGQQVEARAYFERMLRISEKLGDIWGAAGGYSKLGQLAFARGDHELAWRLHQRSLTILRKIGDQRRTAYAYNDLVQVAYMQNKPTEARGFLHQALEIASKTHNLPLAQEILTGIVSILMKDGHDERSAQPAGSVEPLADRNHRRAAELLIVAFSAPWGDPLTAKRAAQLMDAVKSTLPAGQVEQIQAQMQSQTIWDTVDALLTANTDLL